MVLEHLVGRYLEPGGVQISPAHTVVRSSLSAAPATELGGGGVLSAMTGRTGNGKEHGERRTEK